MPTKYRGNGTPERTGSFSFSDTPFRVDMDIDTWQRWRPVPRSSRRLGVDDAWTRRQRREGLRVQLEGPTAAGLTYADTGGDGPVVVLLHGVLMGGSLWDTVVDGLRDRYRCIVPELPFGAHTTPMPDDVDIVDFHYGGEKAAGSAHSRFCNCYATVPVNDPP